MIRRLVNLLKKIHYRLPLWPSVIYMPIVYFIRNIQALLLPMYIIEGEERESGTFLRIGFFGNDSGIRNYWTRVLFRGKPVIKKSSKIVFWAIYSYAYRYINKLDLIIVEINRVTRPFVSSGKGFVLPRWFELLIDVENSLNAIKKNDTHKHIKKQGFTYKARFSHDDLKFFYERMYKPYIMSRHKDSSVVAELSHFLKRFNKKDSMLFFLMKDNEPVAGSFNFSDNGVIRFSVLGILDGQRKILKMGAIRALYYFMLKHYKQKNINIINFEGTSPLLYDGLTQFKLSMRAFPNRKKLFGAKSLWLVPMNETVALRAVLKSNPFIYIAKKKIYRALFIDSSEFNYKHEFMRLMKRTRYKKIDGTKIFCWNGTSKISQWISDEALPDHEVIEFDRQYTP